MKKMKYDDLNIGDEAALSLKADDAAVTGFAKVVGDTNPVHLNEEYAATSFFKKRVAHGMLAAGLVSAVLGTKLPGPGSIYLNQTLEFKRPVYLDDKITAKVKILQKHDKHKKIDLRTWVENQDGQLVLDGQATVLCR